MMLTTLIIEALLKLTFCEIMGAVFGIAGSYLLAMGNDKSRWGWVLFLVSNAFLIAFAINIEAFAMLAMQFVFVITASMGVRNQFFKTATTPV